MLKKWFDWTPPDIAAWERIRAKGLGRFVLWSGVCAFGGVLSVIMGGVTAFRWLRTPTGLPALGLELAQVAAGCVLGGIVNSLLTCWLEERICRKIVAGLSKG